MESIGRCGQLQDEPAKPVFSGTPSSEDIKTS